MLLLLSPGDPGFLHKPAGIKQQDSSGAHFTLDQLGTVTATGVGRGREEVPPNMERKQGDSYLICGLKRVHRCSSHGMF